MKRLLYILTLLILSFVGLSQTQQNLGAPNTNVVVRGLMGIDTGFQYRTSYADTAAANLSLYLSSRAGMTIRTGNTLWIRNSDATQWLEFGSGALYVDTTQTVRLNNNGSFANPLQAHVQISQQQGNALDTLPDGIYVPSMIQNGIISGLRVVWETGLTYTVTAGTYAINGIVYNSPETSITLDNADPSLNRFDGFVATTSSTVIDLVSCRIGYTDTSSAISSCFICAVTDGPADIASSAIPLPAVIVTALLEVVAEVLVMLTKEVVDTPVMSKMSSILRVNPVLATLKSPPAIIVKFKLRLFMSIVVVPVNVPPKVTLLAVAVNPFEAVTVLPKGNHDEPR